MLADGMVPYSLGGATINNVIIPVVTEHIHFTVVKDRENFKGYELLQQEKESQNDEGFDMVESSVTTSVLLTVPITYTKHHDYNNNTGHLALLELFMVVYGHILAQRHISTIDIECVMLLISEYWGAAALIYI